MAPKQCWSGRPSTISAAEQYHPRAGPQGGHPRGQAPAPRARAGRTLSSNSDMVVDSPPGTTSELTSSRSAGSLTSARLGPERPEQPQVFAKITLEGEDTDRPRCARDDAVAPPGGTLPIGGAPTSRARTAG